MGPFPPFHNHLCVLVAMDYVCKWAKAIVTRTNDTKVVINFLKNIFIRFGTLRALLNANGTHLCNKPLESLLKKCGVFHKVATLYHPQTSGHVKFLVLKT